MWRRRIDHLRRAEERERKSAVIEKQMMQPAKEGVNKENVTDLEEEAGIQVELDTLEGEKEIIEEKEKDGRVEIANKPEVAVATHRYQLRQNRRPGKNYQGKH